MIHHNTSNLSFLKMHLLLKEMGIKNNSFFLRLDDPALMDVDPFDNTLDQITIARVLREVSNNVWYFLRECVRIPGGGARVPFELHRGALALTWALMLNLNPYVLWPRQCYKTTTMDAIYCWFFYWGPHNTNGVMFANEGPRVYENLEKLIEIRENLPTYLNLKDGAKDKENRTQIKNHGSNNSFTAIAPAQSEDRARNKGRGFSTQFMWYDEVAFIPHVNLIYNTALFAFSTASKMARDNNNPYHIAFSTTAGYLNSNEGKWAYHQLNSACDFSEILYDKSEEEVKRIIAEGSKNTFIRIEFKHYDLGKDEGYLEEQRSRVGDALDANDVINREVLGLWETVNTGHPLGQRRVALLKKADRKPLKTLIINDLYLLNLYKDPNSFDFNKPLVAGGDVSGNLSQDFTTFVVVDPSDMSVVATMRTNTLSLINFARAIAYVMTNVFQSLIYVPERNNTGIGLIDDLLDIAPSLSKRVYTHTDGKPGFLTNVHGREILFNEILKVAVDSYLNGISDKHILNEMIGLTRKRNGRIDHKPGEHDDMLIAYLIALWFCLHGNDLTHYIDPTIIMSKVSDSTSVERRKTMLEKKNGEMSLQEYGSQLRLKENTVMIGAAVESNIQRELGDEYGSPEALIENFRRNHSDSVSGTVGINEDVEDIDDEDLREMTIDELKELRVRKKVHKEDVDEEVNTSPFASNTKSTLGNNPNNVSISEFLKNY